MELGKIGVWRRRHDGLDAVAEIEALGYGTLWVGGSPSLDQVRPYLERTSRMTIATGILNVWQHEPAEVAGQRAELAREFPGRFLLGFGIGHPEATAEYQTPLQRMGAFFDGLDAAPDPVPRDARAAAALGPKMLDLVGERSLGTHTYFVPVEHTRFARERLGPDALVAPEVAVVVEPDDETARAAARKYAELYLGAAQLHEQPQALRLHRRRHRGRRLGSADRRGDPARIGRAGRRSGARAPRRRRRPRRAPAARPRPRAGGRLRGAGPRAALTALRTAVRSTIRAAV